MELEKLIFLSGLLKFDVPEGFTFASDRSISDFKQLTRMFKLYAIGSCKESHWTSFDSIFYNIVTRNPHRYPQWSPIVEKIEAYKKGLTYNGEVHQVELLLIQIVSTIGSSEGSTGFLASEAKRLVSLCLLPEIEEMGAKVLAVGSGSILWVHPDPDKASEIEKITHIDGYHLTHEITDLILSMPNDVVTLCKPIDGSTHCIKRRKV
jgi:hypothetical protein